MPHTKKKRSEEEEVLDFHEDKPHLEGGGASSRQHIPVRTCIIERARKERPFLLRFVLSPQRELTADLKGNLPGRGVWVTASKAILAEAVKRRAFQRAFRKPVSVANDLPSKVEELLKRSALERLSICNKAGLLVVGFSKVEEALKRREIIALLHAEDAAANGCEKLDRIFEGIFAEKDHIAPKNCFTSAEISLAAGSSNVIHAGLKKGGASSAFLEALDRLGGYSTAEAKDPLAG